MKPNRFICANKLAGITEFGKSGLRVLSGCPRKPAPNSKYCAECKDSESPAMVAAEVSKTTKFTLRKHRSNNATFKDASQDQVYVIESLLEKKTVGSDTHWKVRWLGFPDSEATWEPSKNIQRWMKEFYNEDESRFGKPLPEPIIKCKKVAAGQTYYYLTWGAKDKTSAPEDQWVTEDFFKIASDDGELVTQLDDLSCNTKKTKDKRNRRHTVGILVGSKPCGTVVMFNELYGSESVTQVYANLVDHLDNLPDNEKPKVINYDDACHLVKFAKNHFKKGNQNDTTKYLTEVPIVVDKFHFMNHVDKWCQEHCNPYKIKELEGVNTESCEQTFHWVNQYTSVKSMNESRFFIFFVAIFDYHNLSRLGQLRSVANPKSNFRWEMLNNLPEFEETLMSDSSSNEPELNKVDDETADPELEKVNDSESLSDEMKHLSLGKYECEECGAQYKVPWTLKSHKLKKHGEKNTKCLDCDLTFVDTSSLKEHMTIHSLPKQIFVCHTCEEVFFNKLDLEQHQQTHFVCHICKRICSSKKQLSRHILTHK